MKRRSIAALLSLSVLAASLVINPVQGNGAETLSEWQGQGLLITEVMPMSQNTDDAYEYIEIYNNSYNNIDMKDYKLPYQNFDINTTKIIQPKGVLVICTRSTTTLADFNAFYGTALTQDKFMNLPAVNEVLNSSGSDSIILSKDDGTVVVRASYDRTDFDVKKAVTYKYAETGYDMIKLLQKQTPAPGSITIGQVPDNGTRVTGIALDKSVITMEVNQTAVLYETVAPATAANKGVTWQSDNATIVQVNSNGVLTAKSEGVAVITAKTVDGGFTASCVVVVDKIAVIGVSLNKNTLKLQKGQTEALSVTVKPADATNKAVVWTSSDSSVATVDVNGVVLGRDTGTAVVSIRTVDGNYTAACSVIVNETAQSIPVTGITLNKSNVTLETGKAVALEARVAPSTASNKQVTWSSSNTNVAVVDEKGIVTGKAVGTSVITAKTADGGFTSSCITTVKSKTNEAKVTGIRLNKSFLRLKQGQTEKLVPIFIPGNAQNKRVTWKIDNPEIATITSDGRVTGQKEGYTLITVTTEDGKCHADCLVIVEKAKSHGNGKAKGHFKEKD